MTVISAYKKSKEEKKFQHKCGANGYDYHEKKVYAAQCKICSACNNPNHENEEKDLSDITEIIMHILRSSIADTITLSK